MATITQLPTAKQPRQRPYAKMPLEWDLSWLQVREFSKGLATRMHAIAIGQGYDPPGLRIPQVEGWAALVCHALGVHRRDRNRACAALRELLAQGRLEWVHGRLCVRAEDPPIDPPKPPANGPLDDRLATSNGPLDDRLRSVSTRNPKIDERQILLKERDLKEREERAPAPAREDSPSPERGDTPPVSPEELFREPNLDGPSDPYLIGYRFAEDALLGPTPLDKRSLEFIGSRPEAERETALRVMQGDPWVAQNADVKHAVANWKKFYAQGRRPGQPPPEAPRSRWQRDDDRAPRVSPDRVIELEAELKQVKRRLRETSTEAPEHFDLVKRDADLEMRVRRLKAACS